MRCYAMDNYKMYKILPKLNREKKQDRLNLLSELGVEESCDLQDVEVEDLTNDGLLKPTEARKLVKQWKDTETVKSSCFDCCIFSRCLGRKKKSK